jgi:alcohol dehydrogenase (cytochrome c)
MRSLLIWALCAAASAWGADVTDEALRKADPADWLSYNGSYDSRRHSLLKQINLETVDRLTPKWVFH